MNAIYSINADGRNSTLLQILDKTITTKNKPILILIQDPPKLNREIRIKTYILNYNIISKRGEENGGDEKFNNLILYEKNAIEVIDDSIGDELCTGAEITMNQKLFMTFSIYIKPATKEEELTKTLKLIKEKTSTVGKSRLILGGDVNATNQIWAPMNEIDNCFRDTRKVGAIDLGNLNRKKTRGRMISKFLNEMKLTCMNNIELGPTFKSNIRVELRFKNMNDPQFRYPTSYIDIITLGQKAMRIWKNFELENINGSQHRLLILQSNQSTSTLNKPKNKHVYSVEKIKIESLIPITTSTTKFMRQNFWGFSNTKIKEQTEQLTEIIIDKTLEIQEHIKKEIKSNIKTKNQQYNSAMGQIRRREMTKKLKKLEQKHDRIKNNKNIDKDSLERLEKKIEKQRNSTIYGFAKTMIESLPQTKNKEGERDLWNLVNIIEEIENDTNTTSQGRTNNNNAITSHQQIEKVADEKFNTINIHGNTEEIEPLEEIYITPFETDEAIHRIRKKKFTGPEGIKFTIFNKLLEMEEYKNIIHRWIQMCFKTGYIPKKCRLTTGKLIPKKALGQYRIVHLSSPLSAILEQIALAKLEYRLEDNLLFNPRQFGFVPLKSRHDLITRILELSIKHQINERFTGRTVIIGLDVKGAFDNVDQELLKEKILTELAPDPFRFWLANFIHSRKIKIQYGELTAQERVITRGVPQGSSLGPILWNFTINKIDKGLTMEPSKFEILAYADDIMIVYNGKDNEYLQEKIDNLIINLGQLKLEVEPNKCQLMIVDFANKQEKIKLKIKINQEDIKRVNEMDILGVPLTNKLKLNTEHNKFKERLAKKVELLNLIKKFDIIIDHKEWKILLDSFIYSVIIINNLPILAIDKKSIRWAEKTINKIMRIIFDWPQNCSTKIIKKLTDTFNVELIVKAAIEKMAIKQQYKDGYDLLMRIMQFGGIEGVKNNRQMEIIPSNIRPLSIEDNEGYRYRDPSHNWKLRQQHKIDDMYNKGAIWIAVSSRNTASLFLMAGDMIVKEIKGYHISYPIGYFNLVGLLYKLAKEDDLPSKIIIFNEQNSVYQALKNSLNHDWRINELRERMLINNWSIISINKKDYDEIIKNLISKGRIHKRGNDTNEATALNPQLDVNRISFTWPTVNDYIELHKNKSKLNEEKEQERMNNNTSLSRKITLNTKSWTTLPPSWIDGRTSLMLSGLVANRNGSLEKGEVEQGNTPVGCGQECKRINEENMNNRWNSDTTLHRAFICKHFKRKRHQIKQTINRAMNEKSGEERWRNKPWNENRALETTLENKRYSQTLLRILTEIAFSKPNHYIN